jgi:signal transduction histidine kinase
VRDTGIGISEQDTARLFQPFTQIDSTLARGYEGTGLGLVMVRRLTELQGGSVSLTSVPGQGSTFTVWLPWRHCADSVVSVDTDFSAFSASPA